MNQLAERIIRHSEYYKKCDQIRTGLTYVIQLIKPKMLPNVAL